MTNAKNHIPRLLATVLFTLGLAISGKAQQDPVFTHFWMAESLYNPSVVGNSDLLRVTGLYDAQLSGYENSPNPMAAAVALPMFFAGPQHGMGAYFMNDEAGFFSLKNFALQYAYHRRLFTNSYLSLGLQLDLLNESFDGSKVDTEESNDPAFANGSISGSKIDGSLGLTYRWGDLQVSASAKHLTEPTILMGEKNEISIKRSYYFHAAYNIKLKNPLFSIHPDVFWMYDGVDHKGYIHTRLQYDDDGKMLFGGLSYSPSTSVALAVGGKFHGVVLSYSYEAFTSGVGFGNGNHEIVISYQAPLDIYKKGHNRHKAVRLL